LTGDDNNDEDDDIFDAFGNILENELDSAANGRKRRPTCNCGSCLDCATNLKRYTLDDVVGDAGDGTGVGALASTSDSTTTSSGTTVGTTPDTQRDTFCCTNSEAKS
jgi:hypothetical protein